MARRREEGLALVLVMTVVLALAVVATPFVLSMLLQERSGTVARFDSQAEYGAEGAKNYAMWRLMLSVDPLERRYGTGVFSTYTHDTRNEFLVRLDDQYLSQPQVQFGDPRGVIWGISLQDEQGKLNLRSAPQQMLASLSQAVDGRPGTYTAFLQNGVADLKDYLTMYSGRDASWIAPQRLRPVGHETGTPAGGVTVDNLHFLGKGARVRARKPGLRPLETRVSGNSIVSPTGQDGFSTEQSLAPYVWGVIEVEQRHPVNVNTARRETLVALFEGVRIFGVPQSVVDREAAMQLATRLSGGNLERLEQFLRVLASAPLNGPQKAAIALNAVCPTAALLDGSGTLPVAFKSYDFHSIEAFASVNTPAGTEAAGRGFREIVSVSPPSLLQRACESQFDFVQMLNPMQVALQGIQPNWAFTGYPYGNRMHSYPNPVTMESDTALKNRQAPGKEAYVTMIPSVDHRGRSALYFVGSGTLETYENELQGWTGDGQFAREHYSNEMDGKKVGAEGGAWTKYFGLNHRQSQVPALNNQRPDTAPGGIEFWAKFDAAPTGLNLFDIREADTMNRVTLRVEGTDLILTVCDGTMGVPNLPTDNGWAEVRQPFNPPTDTWIHIGAYWRSTRMGQLALLVDGFPHAQQKFQHKNPENTDLLTKLSGNLDVNSTDPSLDATGHLTGLTPLLIGSEVILYDPSATPKAIRGARGTTAIAHTGQVPVSVWGYTAKLRQDSYRVEFNPNFSRTINCTKLGRTDARLSYNFGLNPQAQVVGDKQNPTTMQWEVDLTQPDIAVTGNVMEFPDRGFIRIGREVIFYTGRSTPGLPAAVGSTGKFTGCQRGVLVLGVQTMPSTHPTGANVDMWSVAVTNPTGFDPEGILQLGEEWFGPLRILNHMGGDYWVPYIDGSVSPPQPLRLLRGLEVFGTVQAAHSGGDMVIPTFLTEALEDWPPNIQPMGRNDWITLTDGSNQREFKRVLMTNPANPPSTQTWPDPGMFPLQWPKYTVRNRNQQLVALDNFVTRDYVADNLHVRALKFPSGELLSRTWLDLANPQVSVGGWSGHIDEQKGFTVPKLSHHLNGAVGTDDANLLLTQPGGFMPQGGLIKIGDEYIGYGTAQGAGLSGLKRGWLNSKKAVHDFGDPIFYLPWAPVSSLQSNVTAQDRTFYLNQALIGDLSKYTRLYALLDRELVLLEWMSPTGGNAWDPRTYTMPPKFDGTSGLYRGMFGTSIEGHNSTDSLVYGLPWRYWDTYKPREFDNTMSYFQWSTKLELAQWRNLRWMQDLPQGEQNLVVHALVRMDGMGEFWDPPAMSDMTALMESTTPGGPINLKRLGHQNDAGQLDVRFYTEYRPNSFDAQAPDQAHSWKRIPKIKEIRVDYDRPSRVLYHEDR